MHRKIPIEVLDCLEYSETSKSHLKWKKKFSAKSGINIGDDAGALDTDRNRYLVGIGYHTYFAHRIVFFIHNPDMDQQLEIDHINGDTSDNRICNLRVANRSENRCNTRKPKSNTSGLKNIEVYTDRRNGKENIRYRVTVKKDFKRYRRIFPHNEQGLSDAISYRNNIIESKHKEFAKIASEFTGTQIHVTESPEG